MESAGRSSPNSSCSFFLTYVCRLGRHPLAGVLFNDCSFPISFLKHKEAIPFALALERFRRKYVHSRSLKSTVFTRGIGWFQFVRYIQLEAVPPALGEAPSKSRST